MYILKMMFRLVMRGSFVISEFQFLKWIMQLFALRFCRCLPSQISALENAASKIISSLEKFQKDPALYKRKLERLNFFVSKTKKQNLEFYCLNELKRKCYVDQYYHVIKLKQKGKSADQFKQKVRAKYSIVPELVISSATNVDVGQIKLLVFFAKTSIIPHQLSNYIK